MVLAGALAALAMPAAAADLRAAETYVSYRYNRLGDRAVTYQTSGDGARTLHLENVPSYAVGYPYVSSVANPFGQVSAVSSTGSITGWLAGGQAAVTYAVAVDGGTSDLVVPIRYIAQLAASVTSTPQAGGSGSATAWLYIAMPDGAWRQHTVSRCTEPCTRNAPDQTAEGSVSLAASGTLLFSAYAETGANGSAIAQASATPYVFIDPDYLRLHPTLTLRLSRYIGNAPLFASVPEPSTWATMLLGFGAVGASVRRRRRAVAPARG